MHELQSLLYSCLCMDPSLRHTVRHTGLVAEHPRKRQVHRLIPTLPPMLTGELQGRVPHKLRDLPSHCIFFRGLFELSRKTPAPSIREGVISITITHLLSMDVEIRWEHICSLPGACPASLCVAQCSIPGVPLPSRSLLQPPAVIVALHDGALPGVSAAVPLSSLHDMKEQCQGSLLLFCLLSVCACSCGAKRGVDAFDRLTAFWAKPGLSCHAADCRHKTFILPSSPISCVRSVSLG